MHPQPTIQRPNQNKKNTLSLFPHAHSQSLIEHRIRFRQLYTIPHFLYNQFCRLPRSRHTTTVHSRDDSCTPASFRFSDNSTLHRRQPFARQNGLLASQGSQMPVLIVGMSLIVLTVPDQQDMAGRTDDWFGCGSRLCRQCSPVRHVAIPIVIP